MIDDEPPADETQRISDVAISSKAEQNDEGGTQDDGEDGQNDHGGEGESSLGLVPSPERFLTVKEMRLMLIDEVYTEAQLRMLAEGCAIVDGIPPEAYAYPLFLPALASLAVDSVAVPLVL